MKLKQQGRVGKFSDYMTCSYAQLDDSFVCKNNLKQLDNEIHKMANIKKNQ